MAAQDQPQAAPQAGKQRATMPQGATGGQGAAGGAKGAQGVQGAQGAGQLGERLQQALQSYSEEVNKAWAPDEVGRRVAQEQQRYLSTLQDFQTGDVRQRVEDAQRELAQGLQSALSPDELQGRFEEAFRSYARSLRDAWTAVPPEEMDVGTLAALAQAAQAGVEMACQTAAAAQQRALVLASMVPAQMRG